MPIHRIASFASVALLVVGSLLGTSTARADDDPGADSDSLGRGAAPQAGHDSKRKKRKKELTIGGRVFARGAVSQDDREGESGEEWLQDVSVASARLNVDYRYRGGARASIEVEFSGSKARMKDVYVRVDAGPGVTVKAGRFKRPISAIALESIWRLPVVERGLLSDLEPRSAIALPFGGRGDGVEVAWERNVGIEPVVTLAAFQHAINDSGLVDVSKTLAMDLYARVAVEPVDDVVAGFTATLTTARKRPDLTSESVSNMPLASADIAMVPVPWLALWVEGFIGASIVYDSDMQTRGTMVGGRSIQALSWRRPFHGRAGIRRAEIYASESLFDPRLSRGGDQGLQLAGGLNLMVHKQLRVQLELERTQIDAPDVLLRNSRTVAYLQLGSVF